MEFIRPVWAEINLNNLKYNFLKLKSITGHTKIIGVVKADAYGHNAVKVSLLLEELGVYALATASLEEALSLRNNGITVPILVLGYVNPEAFSVAAENNILITLFDKNFIKRLLGYRGNKTLNVHINVDTGMGRIGIMPNELLDTIAKIRNITNVHLHGIYTHFSTADSGLSFANAQLKIFKELLKELYSVGIKVDIVHSANSAAILNLKESYFDAVRPGIILYGLSPFDYPIETFKPVMSFKSRIVYVKKIPKGKSISYGRTFISKKDMTVATIPVGYADGLPRALSNNGEVLVKGHRAKIIGRVTMDQTVIDVTGFPYIHPGNEVVIIGKQGGEEIKAIEIAKKIDTINYEIVSRIGKRVKRIFLKEGKSDSKI